MPSLVGSEICIRDRTKGAQDILGLEIQRRIRRAERQEQDYIDISEIPETLREELGIQETEGRIRKDVLGLYKVPSYFDIETGEVISKRGQRPYQKKAKPPPLTTLQEKEEERELLAAAAERGKRSVTPAPTVRPTPPPQLDFATKQIISDYQKYVSGEVPLTSELEAQVNEIGQGLPRIMVRKPVKGVFKKTVAKLGAPSFEETEIIDFTKIDPSFRLPTKTQQKTAPTPTIRGVQKKQRKPLGEFFIRR